MSIVNPIEVLKTQIASLEVTLDKYKRLLAELLSVPGVSSPKEVSVAVAPTTSEAAPWPSGGVIKTKKSPKKKGLHENSAIGAVRRVVKTSPGPISTLQIYESLSSEVKSRMKLESLRACLGVEVKQKRFGRYLEKGVSYYYPANRKPASETLTVPKEARLAAILDILFHAGAKGLVFGKVYRALRQRGLQMPRSSLSNYLLELKRAGRLSFEVKDSTYVHVTQAKTTTGSRVRAVAPTTIGAKWELVYDLLRANVGQWITTKAVFDKLGANGVVLDRNYVYMLLADLRQRGILRYDGLRRAFLLPNVAKLNRNVKPVDRPRKKRTPPPAEEAAPVNRGSITLTPPPAPEPEVSPETGYKAKIDWILNPQAPARYPDYSEYAEYPE